MRVTARGCSSNTIPNRRACDRRVWGEGGARTQALIRVFLLRALSLAALAAPVRAEPDYHLQPDEIAEGVHVFWGHQEALTPGNGAAIANSGFVVGEDAVLVVDPGPTALFAEQMLAAIRAETAAPVAWAVVTHHHPDHAFGSAVFAEAGATVLMHPAARELLERDGETLLGFMTDLVGSAWTEGTDPDTPAEPLTEARMIDLGGRIVRVTPLAGGHTPGDLIVEDMTTETLFAGDLVFVERAATVPHADIETWRAHIAAIKAMPWSRLVPGHGPLVTQAAELDALDDYLAFVDRFTREAWGRGDSPVEALMEPLPARFRDLAEVEVEFQRSLLNLFERYDTQSRDTD